MIGQFVKWTKVVGQGIRMLYNKDINKRDRP